MNNKKVILVILATVLYLKTLSCQNKPVQSISIGLNGAEVGNRSSYIYTPVLWAESYSGLGATGEYLRYLKLLSDSGAFIERFGISLGTRLNFNRYGFYLRYLFPIRNGEEANIRNLQFSLVQNVSFKANRTIVVSLNIAEGVKYSKVIGDSAVSRIFGLVTANGENNLNRFSVDLGIDFSFRLGSGYYFSIGYVNSITKLLRNDVSMYQARREFYPYIRIMKLI